jgi:chorismate mutase-like protein
MYQMKTLQDYRNGIDALDDRIIALLQERFEIVQKVGHYKAQNALDVVQTNRVDEVLNRVRSLASEHGLAPDFVASLYQTMIDHAHVLESAIRKTYEKSGTR